MNDMLKDPEFLKWEHNQVGEKRPSRRLRPLDAFPDECYEVYGYFPGPSFPRTETPQFAGPMVTVKPNVDPANFFGFPPTGMTVTFSALRPEQEEEDAIW